MEFNPDFSRYSYDELLEAKKYLDQAQFPDRYATVLHLLEQHQHKAMASLATVPIEPLPSKAVSKYATFWPRFGAAIIDGLLFTLILYIESLLFGIEYSNQNTLLHAFNGLQLSIYTLVMHGYFGQTLGKMITKVKVLDHASESAISLKQALRRESVNLALNIIYISLLLTVALSIVTSGTISSTLTVAIMSFAVFAVVWSISEFVTMLFNHKRRALHDFIGKTVVVRC
ncbi:RDD family protein [Alishewanella sp. HL-SH05]|uniref:RDD family protein n=1 Tax=Alishewanella sp. HL-SH05 TaxID=3461145 RepID=UPI0040430317